MSTRFYMQNAGQLTGIAPTPHAEWDNTGSMGRTTIRVNRFVSTYTTRNVTDATATANRDTLIQQFISEPLEAQTITGSAKGRMLAMENATANNLRSQCIIYVVSADGATVRGVLYAGDTTTGTSDPTSEWPITTLTNRQMPRAGAGSVNLGSVDAQYGDRLVVETGYRKHVAASVNGTLGYGDANGTQLAEDETGTAVNSAWIQFSQDLVFVDEWPALDLGAGTAGSSIHSRNDDSNNVWTYIAGTYIKTDGSGLAYVDNGSGTESLYHNNATPPSADYAVRMVLEVFTDNDNHALGPLARGSGPNNWYLFRYQLNGNFVELRKNVAGTQTVLGSTVNMTLVDGDELEIRCEGNQISGYVNSVLTIGPITDSSLTAAGRAGFRGFGTASSTVGLGWSEWGAYDLPLPIADLVDAFDDGVVDTDGVWSGFYEDPDAPITEVSGALRITLPNALSGVNYSGIVSNVAYDLTGGEIVLEHSSAPTATNSEAYLLLNQGANYFGFQVSTTALNAIKRISGTPTTLATVTYNATTHRWLRIRESGGTVYFETSADGVTYASAMYSTASLGVGYDTLYIEVGAGTSASATTPAAFVVEGINVLPVQLARPSSDVAVGTWTTHSGGTSNLYQVIDEAIADDADYVKSSVTSTTDTEAKFRIQALNDPLMSTGHIVRYRYSKSSSGGDTVNLRVRLYDSDGTTVIATAQHNNIGSTWIDGSFTLSGAEADAITGYTSGLVIGFLRN